MSESRGIRRAVSSERGATAVTVAISMVLLLGMAALAIDLGAGWNERRQDQTASDLAAMSGALAFGIDQNNEAVVTSILELAQANLTADYSGPNDPDWIAVWRSCEDPDHYPATFREPVAWGSPGSEIECISGSASFLRVRLPDQETATFFGRVLGVDTLTTSADTVVTIELGDGTGLLPFAILGQTPAGEVCLDTGASPEPPCDQNDRGSFGVLLPPQWGDTGLSQSCSANGNDDSNVPEAIATGIDHLLLNYPQAQWSTDPAFSGGRSDAPDRSSVKNSTVNMDLCTTTAGPVAGPADLTPPPGIPVNGVVVDTGNSSKAEITRGLVSEEMFGPGNTERSRLQQTGSSAYVVDIRSGSETWRVDNTPLWEHLVPNGNQNEAGVTVTYGSNAPSNCMPSTITAGVDSADKNDLMAQCLEDYEGSSNVEIFLDSILDSPRFAVAPQLWHNNLGTGFSYRPIEEFRPLYLAGVYFRGQASSLAVWYPDDAVSGTLCWDQGNPASTGCDSLGVDWTTAFLLPRESFSANVAAWYPGFDASAFEPEIFE